MNWPSESSCRRQIADRRQHPGVRLQVAVAILLAEVQKVVVADADVPGAQVVPRRLLWARSRGGPEVEAQSVAAGPLSRHRLKSSASACRRRWRLDRPGSSLPSESRSGPLAFVRRACAARAQPSSQPSPRAPGGGPASRTDEGTSVRAGLAACPQGWGVLHVSGLGCRQGLSPREAGWHRGMGLRGA